MKELPDTSFGGSSEADSMSTAKTTINTLWLLPSLGDGGGTIAAHDDVCSVSESNLCTSRVFPNTASKETAYTYRQPYQELAMWPCWA